MIGSLHSLHAEDAGWDLYLYDKDLIAAQTDKNYITGYDAIEWIAEKLSAKWLETPQAIKMPVEYDTDHSNQMWARLSQEWMDYKRRNPASP